MKVTCRHAVIRFTSLWLTFLFAGVGIADDYVPERGNWERRSAKDLGMNADLLRQAVEFAEANESNDARDLGLGHQNNFISHLLSC